MRPIVCQWDRLLRPLSVLVVASIAFCQSASAQQPAGHHDGLQAPQLDAGTGPPDREPRTVAMLGDQPILSSEVDLALGRTPQLELPPVDVSTLQTAIQLVAQQRQALQTLRRLELVPDHQQLLEWIGRTQHTDEPEKWLRDTAAQWHVSPSRYMDFIAFRLAWGTYLEKHLNERNMQRHYENQRRRFDGSRFEVTIVSVPALAGEGSRRERLASQLARWMRLHDNEIRQGDAVPDPPEPDWRIDHKTWIRGTGAVVPWLVDAVLAMTPGDPPRLVHTPAGVHAVWLHDYQPGDLPFEEVSTAVRTHMLVYLLDYLARQSADALPLRALDEAIATP